MAGGLLTGLLISLMSWAPHAQANPAQTAPLQITAHPALPTHWAAAIETRLRTQLTPLTQNGHARAEVALGAPDTRLRLPPCEHVEAQLAPGTRLAGATRVGLRCTQGTQHWSIYIPVGIAWFGPGWVATAPLPAGHTLAAGDLMPAEIELTASSNPAIPGEHPALGRTLALPLRAGQALYSNALRTRQWFAPGDTVQVRAISGALVVAAQGEAMAPGIEGRSVRVRMEGGKIVTGMAAGERLVEFDL